MIRILISADMEGVSGVVNCDQVTPGHTEYERFRRIMTGDVNAAIKGSIQTGADDVVVTDGHDAGANLLLEELDPRARLNCGHPSPLGMVQGADAGVTVAMFVGYHARAGSLNAVLDHTWAGKVNNLWLNGRVTGEIGLNAALCGSFDVPVIMVSGDQTATAEAADLIPGVELAVVKQARGRTAAECLPIETSQQKIREAAARAISRLRSDMAPGPYKLQPPIMVTIEFQTARMVDQMIVLPGCDRLDARRVQYTADDMLGAYKFVQAATQLAG
ncbi:MAG: M55 family metallopeptidase [Anaerolineaceae bacterium]|nr:M55 family metallopeptidase [Anaerolineaceae bacterium]